MKLTLYQVDAFTNRQFSGNPAAIIFPEEELSTGIMQSIAMENNLAETAFITPKGDDFQIRWFTPTMEVDLCGHATLASAHVLFQHKDESREKITFFSKSGPLYVRKENSLLFLDFPADKITPVSPFPELVDGLGVTPLELYRGKDDFLAVLESEDTITSLAPNLEKLSQTPSRGVIVTSVSSDYDFVSRYFAPQSGIPEDPVTGSSHTALTPYWAKRLNKKELNARQLSRRGGELLCRDNGPRVKIGGKAVTYLIGEISITL